MTKCFVETSAVNRAVSLRCSAPGFRSTLEEKGVTPAVGMQVIYELARTFRSPDNNERAKQLFSFVFDLEPSLLPPTAHLLKEELQKLRTGAAVLPFLTGLAYASVRTEIGRLAQGQFDERAQAATTTIDEEVRRGHPLWADFHIKEVQRLSMNAQNEIRRALSPEEIYLYLTESGQLPGYIDQIFRDLGTPVLPREGVELASRIGEFPALQANVRAHCYLTFICYAYQKAPGLDKLSDYRHVVDASYCGALLAADGQLLKTVPSICPSLVPLSFEDDGSIRNT
jgi:hypothetical protein